MPARSATLDLVALTVFVAGLVYSGGRTAAELAAQSDLRADRRALTREVEAIDAERARMERLVARLNGPEVDAELLEATLRRQLGVGRADEVLLIGPE